MILYHGSYVSVPAPLTGVGRRELDYDIIEGGVANDQVIDTVEDYFAGRITAEQAIGQLKFAKPTHQMCIRTQDIVDRYLHFIDAKPVI